MILRYHFLKLKIMNLALLGLSLFIGLTLSTVIFISVMRKDNKGYKLFDEREM